MWRGVARGDEGRRPSLVQPREGRRIEMIAVVVRDDENVRHQFLWRERRWKQAREIALRPRRRIGQIRVDHNRQSSAPHNVAGLAEPP